MLLAVFVQPAAGPEATNALIAFALFAVAIVFSIATISMSLNLTYFIGKFAVTPQYYLSYYFPESDQKFISIFSVMAGISF